MVENDLGLHPIIGALWISLPALRLKNLGLGLPSETVHAHPTLGSGYHIVGNFQERKLSKVLW